MSIDLRNPLTEDGHEKSILSVMTRSLETAKIIWPEATEADLGDLKLYWDPNNPDEVKAAEAAYKSAKKLGVAFFMLDSKDAIDGVRLDNALTFNEATKKATREKPQRVQGIPPQRGGALAGEEVEDPNEDEDDEDDEDVSQNGNETGGH